MTNGIGMMACAVSLCVACAAAPGELPKTVGHTPATVAPTATDWAPRSRAEEDEAEFGVVPTDSARGDAAPDLAASGRAHTKPPVGFRLCELPDSHDPLLFSSNSAALRPRSEELLSQVVYCMLYGELRSESITVVGHADARGPADYNRTLARARAESVRRYLISGGVDESRVSTRTQGEVQARGSGPESRQFDRRAELLLSGVAARGR